MLVELAVHDCQKGCTSLKQHHVPNSASRASLTARVPAFESPFSLGYLSRTVDTGINLLPLISVEGSALDAVLIGNGFLGTPCCIWLMAVLGVGAGGVLNPRGCEDGIGAGVWIPRGCEDRVGAGALNVGDGMVGLKGAENDGDGWDVEIKGV